MQGDGSLQQIKLRLRLQDEAQEEDALADGVA